MGVAITIPDEYLNINMQMQSMLKQAKSSNDFSSVFATDFVQTVYNLYQTQETFIREQFITNNNYVLDPTGQTTLKFTGNYLLWVFHGYILLINSAIDNPNMINRRSQLIVDLEPYLRLEGQKDGTAASLLALVPKSSVTNRADTTLGWIKYQDIRSFMQSLDPTVLDWMGGSWETHPEFPTIPRTPEANLKASAFYWNVLVDYLCIQFNEAYLPENLNDTIKNIDNWSEILLKGAQDQTIVPFYCPFMQKPLPNTIAMFERLISAVWTSTSTDSLYKIEFITKILEAYNATFYINNGAYNSANLDQYNKDKGLEIIPKVPGWISQLFIKQLCIPNNSLNIDTMVKHLKDLNAFNSLKNNILTEFKGIESLPTLIGSDFSIFYNNVLDLENQDLTAIIADCVAFIGMTQLANELMNTVSDVTLKKEYPASSEDIAFILTTQINAGDPRFIAVVHNFKNGQANVKLDFTDGSTETVLVDVINYFSSVPITQTGPVVVKTVYDVALVVVE